MKIDYSNAHADGKEKLISYSQYANVSSVAGS
jgi:hypothetical protein